MNYERKQRNHIEKNVRRSDHVAFCGLLVALSVALGWIGKMYFTFGAIRVTFENFPVLLAGILFGPFWGAAVGIATDLCSCLLAWSSINPVITIGAACIGLIAGVGAKLSPDVKQFRYLLMITMSAHVVGSMLIKTYGLHAWYYASVFTYGQLLVYRSALYFAIGIIETILLWLLFRNSAVRKAVSRLGGRSL